MNAQQVYTKYLSKEFTENDFLWHMRRDPMLKEHISPVNSKDDVIKILTNRGIIWDKPTEVAEPYDPFKAFAKNLNEGKKLNQKDYQYYVCQIVAPDKMNIVEGFEYPEDAKERMKEMVREGFKGESFKVFSKRFLVSKHINLDDDKNWKDPVDTKGNFKKDDDESFSDPVNNFSEAIDAKGSDSEVAYKIAITALKQYKNPKEAISYLESYAKSNDDQKGNVKIQKAIDLLKKSGNFEDDIEEGGEQDYGQYEPVSGQSPYNEDFKTLKAFPPKKNPINEEEKAEEKKPTKLTYRGDYYKEYENKKGKKNADDVNYYEYTKGWKYELHLPGLADATVEETNKAKEKALKNLLKDPAYYSNLFAKEGMAKLGVKPKDIKNKMGDITTPVDKENGMKLVNKGSKDGFVVNDKSPGQDKNDKAQKTTNKMRSVKESIKDAIKTAIKKMIKEDAGVNGNIDAIRQLRNVKPEELAKQCLNGYNQLSDTRKKVIAAVLGKAVADGNTDQTVGDAFRKLSDDINIKKEVYDNSNAEPNVPGKDKAGDKGISQFDKNIETNEDDSNDIEDDNVEERKSPLSGAEEKTAKHIKPALKSMEKEYGDEAGKKVFYATVRKRTKSENAEDDDFDGVTNQTMEEDYNSNKSFQDLVNKDISDKDIPNAAKALLSAVGNNEKKALEVIDRLIQFTPNKLNSSVSDAEKALKVKNYKKIRSFLMGADKVPVGSKTSFAKKDAFSANEDDRNIK